MCCSTVFTVERLDSSVAPKETITHVFLRVYLGVGRKSSSVYISRTPVAWIVRFKAAKDLPRPRASGEKLKWCSVSSVSTYCRFAGQSASTGCLLTISRTSLIAVAFLSVYYSQWRSCRINIVYENYWALSQWVKFYVYLIFVLLYVGALVIIFIWILLYTCLTRRLPIRVSGESLKHYF